MKRALPRRGKNKLVERRHNRRAEIIDAAATVFATKGFHGASTQDVADLLGVRQASLYYYFPSKEIALEMVCARGVEGFVEAAIRISERRATASEKIKALIEGHLLPLRGDRSYVQVFLNERKHLPADSRRRIGRLSRSIERIFEDVLRAGTKSGEFRPDLDPRLTTLAILGMLNAVPTWWRNDAKVALEQIAETYSSLIISGIRRKNAR